MKKLNQQQLKQLGPRLLKLCSKYYKSLAIGMLALLIASGINLFFPYFIGGVLNNRWGLSIEKDLWWLTLALLFLFAIQSLFFYVRHYTFQSVGYRVVSDLRVILYRALISQDISFFDISRVGDLLSRLTADTQAVQRAITINISVALRYIVQVIGGVILMLSLSFKLSLLIVVLLPVLVIGAALWGKKLRKLSRQMQDDLAEAGVIAEETLSAARTVRAFGNIPLEIGNYSTAVNRSLDAGLARTRVAASFSSTMVFALNAGITLVVVYGAHLVQTGALSLGDLTQFLLYGTLVAVSFGFLVNVWDEFTQAVGAAERIFEIVDLKPQIVSPNTDSVKQLGGKTDLEFRSVEFSYPSRSDVQVIKQLSFYLASGKTLAIVGPSGSGKSTIVSLLLRFYDPDRGEILIGGQNVKELSLEDLYSKLAVVEQQPQVFSLSIGENIRYACPTASSAEVELAAKAANLHNFICSLPQGYETRVGDKGVQLSGGERQRVAIARAILKNPQLLLLDEATSALDSENEALVQSALEHLRDGRTTVIIAHRLSTVQHADLVLVLQDGAILQSGRHSDLLQQEGLYRNLVEHQLL